MGRATHQSNRSNRMRIQVAAIQARCILWGLRSLSLPAQRRRPSPRGLFISLRQRGMAGALFFFHVKLDTAKGAVSSYHEKKNRLLGRFVPSYCVSLSG